MSIGYLRFRVRKEKGKSQIIQGYINLYGKESPRFTTQIRVGDLKWNQKKQEFSPTNELAVANNSVLLEMKSTALNCFLYLKNSGKVVTAKSVKDEFLKVWRKEQKSYTLNQMFDLFFKNVILPQKLDPKTLNKYDNAKIKLGLFLKARYNCNDISIEEMSLQFGHLFFKYLKTDLKLSEPTAKRYIQYINASLKHGFQEELIEKNPLGELEIKAKSNPVKKIIIPEALQLKIYRLDSLTSTEIDIANITTLIFYTAFDHCDYLEFDYNKHIQIKNDVKVIEKIRYKRRKDSNAELCTVTVNNILEEIFSKYPDGLPRYPAKTVTEVYRNLCSRVGFKNYMDITLKQLRKSSGTYYIQNKVPLKVVSERILGHKTVAMTEKYYVTITEDTVVKETTHLRNR